MHLSAVQEANRQYDQGVTPKMLMNETFERIRFGKIIDEIFSLNDRQKSKDLIKSHSRLWTQMQSGSQGISGKKTVNAMTMFDKLFCEENQEPEIDEIIEDSDDAMNDVLGE
jgi:hypothetical protein